MFPSMAAHAQAAGRACSTGLTVAGWPAGRSTFSTFLMIILGIFGVLLVLRLDRRALQPFGRPGLPGRRWHGNARSGNGRRAWLLRRCGYGGRGGGFFSSVLGGLGGALAGNWLYDQFSGGRHGQYGSADTGYMPDSTGVPDQGATPSSAPTTIRAAAHRGMTAAAAMSPVVTGAEVATGAAAAVIGAAAAVTGRPAVGACD